MKAVLAIDSFKGSLSSFEAGCAVREGIKNVFPEAEVIIRPIADGGEGTVDALYVGMNGKKEEILVTGPLGKKVLATYSITEEKIAVIEMSAAAGITLIKPEERNPLKTTTYGVGEMILDAIKKGCRSFIMGIGGSATNDGGAGMLLSLGFDLKDKNGNSISFGAEGLRDLYEIDNKNVIPELSECEFNIACDVKNPLCGEEGATRVYGPQKGATEEMIKDIDTWLLNYADISKKVNPASDKDFPGAGAAGGLGFCFMTFLNGKLKNGIELILEKTRLEDYIKDADLVITGEGRLDGQTLLGKAPFGVASLAKKYKKAVIAFSGCIGKGAKALNANGIDAYFPILQNVCTLKDALDHDNAYENLKNTAEQAVRLFMLKEKNEIR